ncbi:MAG: tRNA(Ile)(2)-agmatinylcytidine synthase [Thermofilaceae archaeon]
MPTELHIGIDDTDSPWGMCTTYLGALLVAEFVKRGYEFIDFPYLVRLNPNVPFKTRGNGAVSIHLTTSTEFDKAAEIVEEYLDRFAHRHGKTDPTAVLLEGPVGTLKEVYSRALSELIPSQTVRKVLEKIGARVIGNAKGRGIIGAAASIGAFGMSYYSYELILYRPLTSRWRCKSVEQDVVELDRLLRPLTYSNVDYSSGRVLATPRGPDPVIAGIRSFTPLVLSSIAPRLAEKWSAQLALIYKTNQSTGEHLAQRKSIAHARPYDSATVRGRVSGEAKTLPGGHTVFALSDDTGRTICAVYRETGFLTKVARLLKDGDIVEVCGGFMPRSKGLTLNVECIRVLHAAPLVSEENPGCPVCGKRLKSAGRNKGYKCVSCGYRTRSATKITRITPRVLEPGLYLQSPTAYRHLSRTRESLGLKPVPAPPLPQLFLWPYPPTT